MSGTYSVLNYIEKYRGACLATWELIYLSVALHGSLGNVINNPLIYSEKEYLNGHSTSIDLQNYALIATNDSSL